MGHLGVGTARGVEGELSESEVGMSVPPAKGGGV